MGNIFRILNRFYIYIFGNYYSLRCDECDNVSCKAIYRPDKKIPKIIHYIKEEKIYI